MCTYVFLVFLFLSFDLQQHFASLIALMCSHQKFIILPTVELLSTKLFLISEKFATKLLLNLCKWNTKTTPNICWALQLLSKKSHTRTSSARSSRKLVRLFLHTNWKGQSNGDVTNRFSRNKILLSIIFIISNLCHFCTQS